MRRVLFAALVLATTANAEVIKCPDTYPGKEVALSEVPSGHKGSGLIRGARLSSAYIQIGKLHSDPNGFDAMQLFPKEIKGGWETEDNFTPQETKWLVCVYGGDKSSVGLIRTTGAIEWWEQIAPKIEHCVLKFMEVKVPHSASLWTATAVCK